MIKLTKENRQSLIFLVPAALLLILSLFSGMRLWLRIVFAVLSLALSLLDNLPSLRGDIGRRCFVSPAVLITVACVTGLAVGHFCSAAAALLIFRVCVILLARRREQTRGMIQTRLSMSGFEAECAGFDPTPAVSGRLLSFISGKLSYILIALAAVVLILTAALFHKGAAEGLYRFALIISAASAASLFSAFPLADYASVTAAAENGAVFSDGAISKLIAMDAVSPYPVKPVSFGSISVAAVSDDPMAAQSLIMLAAHAFRAVSDSSERMAVLANDLSAACGSEMGLSSVRDARELDGMGVIARIHDVTVLAGSAQLISKSGLPLVGFSDLDKHVHVAVNGRYAGCILLSHASQSNAELLAELNSLGLRLVTDPADRKDGETVLGFSRSGIAPSEPGDCDIYAAECGYAFKNEERTPDVRVCGAGTPAVHRVLRLVYNALSVRTGALAIAALVKLFVLLLGIFGFIPLWTAVLAQAAAVYASYIFVLRALDFTV